MIKVFLNVALRISNLITAYALITNSVLADWQTDDQKINIVSRDDANAQYAIGLLKLAISKLEKPYNVNVTHGELTAMRLKESVKSGSIDVIWTATNNDLENELIPVRVPLDKGLLGYRIFILHKDNKRLLDNVNTIDELRRFTMGQGRGWSDADILRSNGFNVILAPKYEGLFHMIDGKRFQLFPRGVNEPFSEIEKRPDLDLSIDDNIMLVYRMPYYFFINPAKKQLADDIEKGLITAINDGSFDKYFYESETTKKAIQNVKFNSRRVFELNNPNLPPQTPINNPKLWVRVNELR